MRGLRVKNFLVLFLTMVVFATSVYSIDRRKDQYSYDFGYLLIPAPYSLPGIGEGIAYVAMANNVFSSQTDLIYNALTGDVKGYGAGISELYLLDKSIRLDIFHQELDKATVKNYNSRGMGSGKDDYTNITIDNLNFSTIRLTNSYFERRLEFSGLYYKNMYDVNSLSDKDGLVILDSDGADKQKSDTFSFSVILDITDDRIDPRVGLRYEHSLDYTPNENSLSADYYVINKNLTAYIPIGKQSTWAFNYFRSDAHVIDEGETDVQKLQNSYGLDCDSLDGADKNNCNNLINNVIAANKYGTASSLGGRSRLRSYPELRFQGAHSEFFGTELRLNLTEENTPFNLLFINDIRSSVQTSFFYEKGSVADQLDDLGKDEKESYGVGLRLVAGSGLVYRLDVAFGDEGSEYTMIVNYPWESF